MNRAIGTLAAFAGLLFFVSGPLSAQQGDNRNPLPPPLPADTAQQPPPLPAQTQRTYYVEEAGKRVGPLGLAEIKQRIQSGTLQKHNLVWREGLPAWSSADKVPELHAIFRQQPPTLPKGTKHRTYMVGLWEGSTTDQFGGRSHSIVRYNADGSFSGTQTLTNFGVTQSFPQSGTWTVTTLSPDRFTLTVTFSQATQLQTGAIGPQHFTYTVVDQNTLRNEDMGFYAYRKGR